MAEIGIYWAEFAPANCGHLRSAQKMVDTFSLDALCLLDKYSVSRTDCEPSPESRLQMIADACDGIHGNIALFIATTHNFADLQKYLEHADGNVHLFLDSNVLFALSQQEQAWLSQHCPYTVSCTKKEQRMAEETLAVRPAEFWTTEFSTVTARRMMQLRCSEQYFPPRVLEYAQECHFYGLGMDYTDLSEDALLAAIEPLYDARRLTHVMGCRDTATKLAVRHGADEVAAARAGLLHDITKALPTTEQLQLCKKYGIMTERYQDDMANILHGKTAAAIAENLFGESPEVCSAIAWHTTGRADMTLLEKIVYIADYIEPTRSFDGVEDLRTLAFQDLDAAVIRGIDMTIEILTKRNRPINRDSLEARDYLTLGDMK